MFNRDAVSLSDSNVPRYDRGRTLTLVALAIAFAAYAVLAAPSLMISRAAVAIAATLMMTLAVVLVVRALLRRSRRMALDMLNDFISLDATPTFLTTEDGEVVSRNPAALTRFNDLTALTLAASLRSVIANPTSLLFRLQTRAQEDGSAKEDVATRLGNVRLSAHKLDSNRFLWRLEDLHDRGGAGKNSDDFPIPVLTVGRSGTILYMNDAARRLAGERSKSLERLFDALPYRLDDVNTINTSQGPRQVVVKEVEVSAGRRELYLQEVTRLGHDKNTQDNVVAGLPVALIKLERDGKILNCNNAALQLLGDSAEDAVYLSDVMQGLGRPIEDWVRQTVTGEKGAATEFLRLSRSDREIFVQVSLNRMATGDDVNLIAVLNDATELKTLEAQFVQSQKMQAIGQLAGGVAHDFNNLLTAISGHCDLLLLRHDQNDQDYGDLVQINQNANRAAALVGQLLAFSRKQMLRPEVLDLRDTVSDLTHLLNRLVGEKVSLTLNHDPSLSSVRADKRQLEQVLMNLVVNARDAMPKGGQIRIETENVHLREPLERNRAKVPAGDYVTVKVIDEGIGIPDDKIEKIFEPFYTSKRTGEGTGLGLSTVYGIIKQTGGFIFVDSVVGEGSCFSVYLPSYDQIDEPAAPMPAAKRQPASPKHGEGVVLLVEDEAPVRAFASRALRLRGYTVLEAESAEDALQTLEDKNVAVDLFVTDVVMPGMDGPSWVRKALETRPDVRVIFVSGYAEGALQERDDDIPNSVFLPKPFSLIELADTVHRQLH